MLVPTILLFVASAFGQGEVGPQAAQGRLQLVLGAERDPDTSFGGLSGLGIDNPSAEDIAADPNAAAVFWAVSDDSRPGTDVSTNPRYFDGSVIFKRGADGQFDMDAKVSMVFPLPLRSDVESDVLNPEGLHFCGEFLYVGNGASDVRRFRPTRDTAASIDSVYPVPRGYYADAAIEGVAVEKSSSGGPFLYSVTGGAPARYAFLPNNPVSILEWDANTRELKREFLIPQAANERTMDIVWESGRRFLFLVAVGDSDALTESLGKAARPERIRFYSGELPPIGQDNKDVLNMDPAQIQAGGDAMMVERFLMAETLCMEPGGLEVEVADEPEVDELLLKQDGKEVLPRITFKSRIPGDFLPLFDGMAFGPAPAQAGDPRPLYLISDNSFDSNVPTRYILMNYTPPPIA